MSEPDSAALVASAHEERCTLTRFLYDLDWDRSDIADIQEWMTERLAALGGPVSNEEAWGG